MREGRKVFRFTFANPMKLIGELTSGKLWETRNVYIMMRGAIDVKDGNERNFDAYAMSSTIGYRNAAERLVVMANVTRVKEWFFYDTLHGVIWKIKFKTFGFSVEELAVWDREKGDFNVKTGKNDNEPMYLREFIISAKKPKKKSKSVFKK